VEQLENANDQITTDEAHRNLEAKATSAHKQKPKSEAEMAASLEALRQSFKAIRAQHELHAALPLVEQLRLSRDDLAALLTKQAELKLHSGQVDPPLDDGLLRLKERMKRCCIQQLEAKVILEAERVDTGL